MKKAMKQSVALRILSTVSILVTILTVGMMFCVSSANGKMRDQLQIKMDLIENANIFKNASGYLTDEVRAYGVTGDVKHLNNYNNEVQTAKNREKAVAAMVEIGITDEEKSLIDQISNLSNNLVPVEEKAMQEAKTGNTQAATALLYNDFYTDSTIKISTTTDAFFEQINTRTSGNISQITAWVNIFQIIMVISLSAVFIMQIILVVFVNQKIFVPVDKIRKNMILLAEGDLSAQLSVEPDTSEIGQLANAIHTTKNSLNVIIGDIGHLLGEMATGNFRVASDKFDQYVGDYMQIMDSMRTLGKGQNYTLSQINVAADQVSSGAEQIAVGAQALSQGATEQAASVQELSATISEITKQIGLNAENAKQATDITVKTSEEVLVGNKHMTDMIAAMQDITEKSGEISKIIKTIEDIAFQTNILALNAAVEAARAGTAGKGFAVVADEVRNLAGKSAEAAKSTTMLIESTVNAISTGTEIVNTTAASLSGIVGNVEHIKNLITEIAQESDRQASGANQVSIGIEQISAVTQTNSATAEESAAASEELSGQSQMLKELMSQYKL